MSAFAGKPSDDHSEQEEWESKEQLEEQLAKIEEEVSEAKRGGKKKMIQELEVAREDILSQLERFELEDKVEELQRLREEASAFGRGSEAREYSEEIDKHEAKLKDLEVQPAREIGSQQRKRFCGRKLSQSFW